MESTTSKTEWEQALRNSSGPTLAQRGVWQTLATYADYKTGLNITVSKQSMAERFGVHRKTIERIIREGVEQGWLEETGRIGSTGPKVYRLTIPANAGKTVSRPPKVWEDKRPEHERLNVKPLRRVYKETTAETEQQDEQADPEHYGYSAERIDKIVQFIKKATGEELDGVGAKFPELASKPGPVMRALHARRQELKPEQPEGWEQW